jgi:hypothetical protein
MAVVSEIFVAVTLKGMVSAAAGENNKTNPAKQMMGPEKLCLKLRISMASISE